MPSLLPCPFCGHVPDHVGMSISSDGDGIEKRYTVLCTNHGCSMYCVSTKAYRTLRTAKKHWNMRWEDGNESKTEYPIDCLNSSREPCECGEAVFKDAQ